MAPRPVLRDSHAANENSPRASAAPLGIPLPGRGHQFDHGADSSSSDSELHPPNPTKSMARPRHSRSMSTPFPSFFSVGKKKGPDSVGEMSLIWDSDASDDDRPGSIGHRGPKRGSPQRSGYQRNSSRDFTSGNCMTCGSQMRWPRELKTFRCTLCLTINDLVPMSTSHRGERSPSGTRGIPPNTVPSTDGPPPPSVKPISTSHTRSIVRRCLRSFFKTSLGCNEPQPSGSNGILADGETLSDFAALGQGQARVVSGLNSPVSHTPQTTVFPGSRAENASVSPTPLVPHRHANVRSYSSSYTSRPALGFARKPDEQTYRPRSDDIEEKARRIFRPLEDYLISCFSSFECVNSSFSTRQDHARMNSADMAEGRRTIHKRVDSAPSLTTPLLDELDHKLLMVGDIAENGSLWVGGYNDSILPRGPGQRQSDTRSHVSHRSPHMDWDDLLAWYDTVIHPARGWLKVCDELVTEYALDSPAPDQLGTFERELLKGQGHAQMVLLTATESLLRRPGRPLTDPDNFRFLLIALHNPLLRSHNGSTSSAPQPDPDNARRGDPSCPPPKLHLIQGHRSGIIKRIIGLIAQSPTICHNYLISWLARLPRDHFKQIKDIVGGFLAYRLLRQSNNQPGVNIDVTGGLVPRLGGGVSVSTLHAALEAPAPPNAKSKAKHNEKKVYGGDWQIRAASKVMALVFTANNLPMSPRRGLTHASSQANGENGNSIQHGGLQARRQILPTSEFYEPLIDIMDLVVDFETWETKPRTFSFCQYPFLLSIAAKTDVLEHEARRQMRSKARDAFFDSILYRRNVNQYWVLDVRRDCLVEDSLKGVSEIIGSGSEDIKKSLRISFSGEEGIDHGGLRKEWFLLLIREIFNPDNGMFIHEEDSNYCYFNPYCFETSDQFFLVGVVMGLAIYNSTILDIPLPPFTFKKLLATGPAPPLGSAAHPKLILSYGLDDLAEVRPLVANGLRQLLEYDGNVEESFVLDFTISIDKYGTSIQVPLIPGGEDQPVTNENRRKYVDLYVQHILDASVSRQFEPFKRGFYTVCAGNALTLFRPEEIELLVRGSDEPLDISSLRGAAVYENWCTDSPDDGSEPAVQWFWEAFEGAAPGDQRRLLLFVTGSDRIPAAGASSLRMKISCLGDDCERLPIARTCFNMLVLWRYDSREKLERKLWMAAYGSEGFGLK